MVQIKKKLFGYSVSEVDLILESLKKENESLNAAIAAFKQLRDDTNAMREEISRLEAERKLHQEAVAEKTRRIAELEAELNAIDEALVRIMDRLRG